MLASILGVQQSRCEPLTAQQAAELARQCGPSVAPLTIVAVAKTESGIDPLAIHDNTTGETAAPATAELAAQMATVLMAAGHSVDLGLMQINSANLTRLGMTPASAFDPCRSIEGAAAVLAGSYVGGDTHEAEQASLRGALSSYNTGDPVRGLANGYVQKVSLSAQQVVPAIDLPGLAPHSAPVPVQSLSIAPPADPDAPPSWNVWALSDYQSAGRSGQHDTPQAITVAPVFASADDAASPTITPTIPTGAK